MYLLIDEQENKIVKAAELSRSNELRKQDVFPEASEEQRMVWFEGDHFPEYFEVNQQGELTELSIAKRVERGFLELKDDELIIDGEIKVKSLEQQVSEGTFVLKPEQKVENNEIVLKTQKEQLAEQLIELERPYQYLDGDDIKRWTIAQVVENNTELSIEDANTLKADLKLEVEKALAAEYSPGYELKITKDYSVWVADGQPANDPREQKFVSMQESIAQIKASYRDLKLKIDKLTSTED